MTKMKEMTDKDFGQRKPYFEEGPHEVYIKSFKVGKANSGSDFLEFTVLGEEDVEGKVTLWVTEKSMERTRSILAAIAVHNKNTDEDKQKVRDAFKKITDSDQLLQQSFAAKFVDMQAWILTEEDTTGAQKPTGGYYMRNNLYSYPPKPRAKSAATTAKEDLSKPADPDEIPF